MDSELIVITPIDYPDYQDRISQISEEIWPEFMLKDPLAEKYWGGLFDHFPEYQFAIFDKKSNTVVGRANSVPLFWDREISDLPDEGWDWALTKSAMDFKNKQKANTLCAIEIGIVSEFQGKGLSSKFLQEMIALVKKHKLNNLIAPIRPSIKDKYPLTSIEAFIKWKNNKKLPFDPWLRVHVRSGGKILKPCKKSMSITGSVADWESWTNMKFPESGAYVVPGALIPIIIDIKKDEGLYLEPNVWVLHEVN
jgi:L-amino acid N-acyltransferase YncA